MPEKSRRFCGQFSIWVFIAQESDECGINAKSYAESAPVLRFAIRAIAVTSRVETCEKSRVLHVFARDATAFARITNQRTGDDLSHRNAMFSYTSLLYAINIQTPNRAGSFHGAPRRTAGRTVGEPWSTLPTLCTSRVVSDPARDRQHSVSIHLVIGEAATMQHTMIIDR